jgi:phosphopentomutase
VLDRVSAAGLPVVAIGKVADLFAGRGITESVHTRDDLDGMARTIDAMRTTRAGLIVTTLVDLDTLFGHRNDPRGYGEALQCIDREMAKVVAGLRPADLLVITADHGNDPTSASTDHSREYVPVLAAGRGVRGGTDLGVRPTFAEVGATVAAALKVAPPVVGTSFLDETPAPR